VGDGIQTKFPKINKRRKKFLFEIFWFLKVDKKEKV
jgi:hypothetical protein